MSNKLYKYVGHTYLEKVIGSKDLVTLKCSYPKDFNDAYELFLTIDFTGTPERLAFYEDVIVALPQNPTTCFSRSPIVTPMWAHYAQNLEGFVVEFDEDELKKYFPESLFGTIDYRDEPNPALNDTLERAYELGKPRYFHMLRGQVFRAAYTNKMTCWSYEQERRMLVDESEVRKENDLILMDIPKGCVSALICGPRASIETIEAIQAKALQYDCSFYQLRIGRSSCTPFFVDLKGGVHGFNGEVIEECLSHCKSCKEPINDDLELCTWCQINDNHKINAAGRNTYRMLDHYGLLDDYIASMSQLARKRRG